MLSNLIIFLMFLSPHIIIDEKVALEFTINEDGINKINKLFNDKKNVDLIQDVLENNLISSDYDYEKKVLKFIVKFK